MHEQPTRPDTAGATRHAAPPCGNDAADVLRHLWQAWRQCHGRATFVSRTRAACRVFKCARGLKQHVHMVHTLATVAVQPRQRYECGACGAAFANRRGAQLHAAECGQAPIVYVRKGAAAPAERIASPYVTGGRGTCGEAVRAHCGTESGHGEDERRASAAAGGGGAHAAAEVSVLAGGGGPRGAEVAAGGGAEQAGEDRGAGLGVATGVAVCARCGLQFGSDGEERAHHAWLAPREEVHRCGRCGRGFGDGRALRQHAAVCAVANGGAGGVARPPAGNRVL